MLLRSSISGTKRFFTKTLHSFKSLFSCGSYQKLEKNHPHVNMISNDFDDFYNEFNDRWSTNDGGARRRRKSAQSLTKEDGLFNPSANPTPISKKLEKQSKKAVESSSDEENQKRNLMVVQQRLKEMERMDVRDVDHVLDIEEVLHYYSRLTCPAYIDIVDKFFIEIYAEFFTSSPTKINPEAIINSNPKMEVKS